MSEVLTEIIRMDPTFDKEEFIKQCQFDIIPNILEVLSMRYLIPVITCCFKKQIYWLENCTNLRTLVERRILKEYLFTN